MKPEPSPDSFWLPLQRKDAPQSNFLSKRRLNLALALALVVQILYWYLGSPGPMLAADYQADIKQASINIAYAVLLLFLVPLVLLLVWKAPLKEMGLRLGNYRLGLGLVGAGFVLVFLGLAFFARDSSLQQSYPWAGAWPGQSVGHFLLWAGLYSLYYLAFEFFYRGFMLQGLRFYFDAHTTLWLQVICSSLIHAGKPLLETLAAIPAGFVFAYLARRTGSLLYPILIHLALGISADFWLLWYQGLLFPGG